MKRNTDKPTSKKCVNTLVTEVLDPRDEGAPYRLVYYVDEKGRSPAKQHVLKQFRKDAQGKIRLETKLELIEKLGEDTPSAFLVWETGKIFAFKNISLKIRIYCFQDGRDWVFTNAVKKKEDKADPKELKKAEQIRQIYFRRKGESV